MHYYALEPWGVEVDDFRMAALFSLMAAGVGAKGFDPSPLTVTSAVRAAAGATQNEQDDVDAAIAKVDRLLGGVH